MTAIDLDRLRHVHPSLLEIVVRRLLEFHAPVERRSGKADELTAIAMDIKTGNCRLG